MTARRRCPLCRASSPPEARFCMHCGAPLPPPAEDAPDPAREFERAAPPGTDPDRSPRPRVGLGVFLLTALGTLLLSAVLVFVFGLPIFLFGAVLPVVWLGRRRRT